MVVISVNPPTPTPLFPHMQLHTSSLVISSKETERSLRQRVSHTSCHPNDDELAASTLRPEHPPPPSPQSSPDVAFMYSQAL